jgi:hypothetical protein
MVRWCSLGLHDADYVVRPARKSTRFRLIYRVDDEP